MSQITYIGFPPVNKPFLMNNQVHPEWQRWFTKLTQSSNENYPNLGSSNQPRPTFGLTEMTTAERDALSNVPNGTMIYNTTTHKGQIYENGCWGNLT